MLPEFVLEPWGPQGHPKPGPHAEGCSLIPGAEVGEA